MATKSKSSVDTANAAENELVHVPNPLFQYGTLDTTDTASASAGELMYTTSPVFEVGRARTLRNAMRALDPDDNEVPADLVTLPSGGVQMWGTAKTAEEGRDEVRRAAEYYEQNPVGPPASSSSAASGTETSSASSSGSAGSRSSSSSS